jgi:hypothetical protein
MNERHNLCKYTKTFYSGDYWWDEVAIFSTSCIFKIWNSNEKIYDF